MSLVTDAQTDPRSPPHEGKGSGLGTVDTREGGGLTRGEAGVGERGSQTPSRPRHRVFTGLSLRVTLATETDTYIRTHVRLAG